MKLIKRLIFLLSLSSTLVACANIKENKINSFDIYNPNDKAIFPVTSTIFYNQHESMLIDAQFSVQDAKNIVGLIKKSGKPLTLIYISHSDPDFYFGLEEILKAYPQAKVIATQATVNKIKQTGEDKLNYWQKPLGLNAPSKIIIPHALTDNIIHFGDDRFEIKGTDAGRTYLWLPSMKIIVGGSLLSNNMHIWTADAKTSPERLFWDKEILDMLILQPEVVIAGHYLGQPPKSTEAIDFTSQYLKTLNELTSRYHSSDKIIDGMKKRYPNLNGEINLTMSAKIITGEMISN